MQAEPRALHRPVGDVGPHRHAGFRAARHVALSDLAHRYFAGRTDGFRPSSGEDLLVATT
jgi:hypothetical protein